MKRVNRPRQGGAQKSALTAGKSAPRGRAAVALVGALTLLTGLLVTTAATASAEPQEAVSAVTVAEDDLAKAVEHINRKIYVEKQQESAFVLQRSVNKEASRLAAQPLALRSLATEADRIEEVAEQFHADGRIEVTDVETSVDSVETDGGVRFVTLHIARTLGDGQVWEELQPFAVIDAPLGTLRPGQFFAVDGEAVQYDQVPAELLDLDSVPEFDPNEFNDPDLPTPPVPATGPAVEPSSTEPLDGSEVPGGIETMALSAAKRTKVKNYALKHALSPNSAYHKWSQDCTNFVSQSLKAGGWSHDLGWYRSDSNWWYTGNIGIRASWTWAGAANFFRFARIESKRATGWSNVYQLRNGDILQYANSTNYNKMVHSMVTTGHSGNVPLLSYHTSNTKNKPFTAINTKGRTWWASKV
ncbi:amidase domain-containing protein [Streptomyces californicus]|uniref:amidase domain-containing protein n=1 Tax=Streptomyces TaxID=1883 RepID=UPI0019007C4A|nr:MULTISPECIES: amidase domain-containing protein [unclassified Streptomyces]MBK0375226.1 amidase domain-containing protein [Streptomyces sp. RB110-1]MBK0388400.1 amidase domain-containing protein [Streptomyces sp. RB110-2]